MKRLAEHPVHAHHVLTNIGVRSASVLNTVVGKETSVSLPPESITLTPVLESQLHTDLKKCIKKPKTFNSRIDFLALLKGDFILKLLSLQHISCEGVFGHTLGEGVLSETWPSLLAEDFTWDHQEQECDSQYSHLLPFKRGSSSRGDLAKT